MLQDSSHLTVLCVIVLESDQEKFFIIWEILNCQFVTKTEWNNDVSQTVFTTKSVRAVVQKKRVGLPFYIKQFRKTFTQKNKKQQVWRK